MKKTSFDPRQSCHWQDYHGMLAGLSWYVGRIVTIMAGFSPMTLLIIVVSKISVRSNHINF